MLPQMAREILCVIPDSLKVDGIMIVEISEQAEARTDQVDLHLIGAGAGGFVHLQNFDEALLDDVDLVKGDQPAHEQETRQAPDSQPQLFAYG